MTNNTRTLKAEHIVNTEALELAIELFDPANGAYPEYIDAVWEAVGGIEEDAWKAITLHRGIQAGFGVVARAAASLNTLTFAPGRA